MSALTNREMMKQKGDANLIPFRTKTRREHYSLAEEWNFDQDFDELLRHYIQSGLPVAVNFRQLVPFSSGVDRSTHLIHSYPAKLLANIPLFFLNCSQVCSKNATVLDPFCGTGTVLLEAILARRSTVGADANPLARLIAHAKTKFIDRGTICQAQERILEALPNATPVRFSEVIELRRWFAPSTAKKLGQLLGAIRTECEGDVLRFMEVCFSSIVKKVSFADPRVSVPVRAKSDILIKSRRRAQVVPLFIQAVNVNGDRLQSLRVVQEFSEFMIFDDVRTLSSFPGHECPTVDLIITSPPYVGAQKYIRASSLSIGWLGLAPDSKLRHLERKNIGREHFPKAEYGNAPQSPVPAAQSALFRIWKSNPLRAHIAATYLTEMTAALSIACGQLSKGGHFVLVIGNNNICGEPFLTCQYMRDIIEGNGLSLELELIDDIRSRGLMTKRNKTAGLITREHILVFQKR
jgi:hypothetical protein